MNKIRLFMTLSLFTSYQYFLNSSAAVMPQRKRGSTSINLTFTG